MFKHLFFSFNQTKYKEFSQKFLLLKYLKYIEGHFEEISEKILLYLKKKNNAFIEKSHKISIFFHISKNFSS